MTDAAPHDVKRRRSSTDDGSSQGVRRLADLPTGILAHASSFLAAPSRALFAIALDENLVITPNERSSAIVGNQWDTLDFGQIEKDLAAKLSDDDIKGVLLCVDAVNNVKRLKLANCTNITGAGLEPLRDSLIIEQVDLSLVGEHQNPDIDPEPTISCGIVLPILDSIIAREGCALMHLQFPLVWRKEPSIFSDFYAFIGRYNQMRRNGGPVRCLECNRSLPLYRSDSWIEIDEENYYGTHMYTCYDCLKHYCHGCEDGAGKKMLHYCNICNRDYCKGCSEMTHCSCCGDKICNDCCKYECVKCHKNFCSECEKGNHINKCEHCDKCYCRGCYDDEDVDVIYTCSRCNVECCEDCRLQRYREGQLNCIQCVKESVAVDKSFERTQLKDENEQLKVEMEELKREIKGLELENEELRSKLT